MTFFEKWEVRFIMNFVVDKNSNSQQKITQSNYFIYFRQKSKNTNKQNNTIL